MPGSLLPEHLQERELLRGLQALLPQLDDVHPGTEHSVQEGREITLPLPGVRAQVEPGRREPVPDTVRRAGYLGRAGHGQAGCSVVAAGPVSRSSTLMLPRVAREYGQTWWAASAASRACSGLAFGR